MSLLELLDERPDDETTIAVYAGDTEMTRAELRTAAEIVSERLAALGMNWGDAVCVRLPNGPELIAALFGVWMAGGVYVPLNPRATASEVEHVLDEVGPRLIIGTDGIEMVLGDAVTYDPDVALITFTSGTTGAPKPIEQRHSGVLDMFQPVLAKLLGDAAGSVEDRPAPMPNLIPLSLSLWAGLYNVLFAFRVGAAVVLMERFDPPEFAQLVERLSIRSTVLPPAAMVMLSDDETVTSLAPLKFVRSITAPLSPLQARRFRDRFGVGILNCYGQTEFGGEIVGWNAQDAREFGESHLGAAGRPHTGVSLRILDGDGAQVDPGDEGELWVKTPAIDAAVAGGVDYADRMSPDGWFRSGDIGRLDAEGFLWIDGRVSDMINRGGMKVHPGEVEEVLRLSPDVADAAVVAAPDDRLGEVPWAFVVLAGAVAELDEPALVELCREHLAPYKIPTRFVVVDELPRNEVGKVLRRQLLTDHT